MCSGEVSFEAPQFVWLRARKFWHALYTPTCPVTKVTSIGENLRAKYKPKVKSIGENLRAKYTTLRQRKRVFSTCSATSFMP